jgi:2-iminobutanoate/2-iminopropanoate deaminase
LPAAVVLAVICVLVSSALVGCSGDTTSSEADRSAAVSEVFGQDDTRGYSMAARYGDLVWTAGHLPESASPGDSIETQTEAVMKDLEATLEEAGAGFDTVVMTNVYLADFDDWPGFNETYKRYFGVRLPPRVTVEVSSLAFGLIEISMVAHVRGA